MAEMNNDRRQPLEPKFPIVNRETLYQEVLERGKRDAIDDYGAYRDLVEQVVEEHRELGELSDQDPLEGYEDWLEEEWQRYQEETGLTGEQESL